MKNTQLIKTIAATALLVGTLGAMTIPASAGSQVCGNYVIGGASKNWNTANKIAKKVGGNVWDLDKSNSPNAGKGFWVVADGPFISSEAKKRVRRWKKKGAKGAYRKNMCFTGV